jgi:N-acetylmuramic acid 6-phosphate etherase
MTQTARDIRLTEQRNPRTQQIDMASPREIVDLINAEDALVAGAVAAVASEVTRALELAEAAFRSGGRLIYAGAGTSGRLGVLDATECPPTFGSPPEMVQGIIAGGDAALRRSVEGAEDKPGDARDAIGLLTVGAKDFVLGIAASGTTPYVRAALEAAREAGARTGFLTCSAPPDGIRGLCDVCIVAAVGPEVVTGSTRMKAGTATKMILNIITTGAMIRLGKIYGNLMVDLRAWNEKLRDRSERIVMQTTGLDRSAARAVIDGAGGGVKLAIVMARRHVGRDEAERLLLEHDGRLRAIVGDPPPMAAS